MRGAPPVDSTDINMHQIRNSAFLTERKNEGRRNTVFIEAAAHRKSTKFLSFTSAPNDFLKFRFFLHGSIPFIKFAVKYIFLHNSY